MISGSLLIHAQLTDNLYFIYQSVPKLMHYAIMHLVELNDAILLNGILIYNIIYILYYILYAF